MNKPGIRVTSRVTYLAAPLLLVLLAGPARSDKKPSAPAKAPSAPHSSAPKPAGGAPKSSGPSTVLMAQLQLLTGRVLPDTVAPQPLPDIRARRLLPTRPRLHRTPPRPAAPRARPPLAAQGALLPRAGQRTRLRAMQRPRALPPARALQLILSARKAAKALPRRPKVTLLW